MVYFFCRQKRVNKYEIGKCKHKNIKTDDGIHNANEY